MVNEACVITVDASLHGLSITNEDKAREDKNDLLNSILDDFTTEQFKSSFFLLIDYLSNEDDFFSISKQERPKLKEKLREIIKNHNNELLIELLGTLKFYKHLRVLGTCSHIYKNCQGTRFNMIDNIWKMLFLLCEEITDDHLVLLKELQPSSVKNQIVVAEDYFFSAFKRNIFSKKDVSKLREIFQTHPVCSKIIQDFEANFNRYTIKTPTSTSDCGITLIFNFDRILDLPKREGSDIDVKSLETLWKEFGFETKIFTNLTCEETFKELKSCASSYHADYDVFVCCFLSHGKSGSVISSDGVEMPIETLQAKIINHSKSLVSKPKLFFIQACQGDYCIQKGARKPIHCTRSNTEPSIKKCVIGMETPPIKSDVLLVVSTINGYVSFREPGKGSWFVNALCYAMKRAGDKKSILDIMMEVINDVQEKKADLGPGMPRMASQIVEYSSTLRKLLILKKRIC